jgi:hypothetical protein
MDDLGQTRELHVAPGTIHDVGAMTWRRGARGWT